VDDAVAGVRSNGAIRIPAPVAVRDAVDGRAPVRDAVAARTAVRPRTAVRACGSARATGVTAARSARRTISTARSTALAAATRVRGSGRADRAPAREGEDRGKADDVAHTHAEPWPARATFIE
jgi:hypothetical protein